MCRHFVYASISLLCYFLCANFFCCSLLRCRCVRKQIGKQSRKSKVLESEFFCCCPFNNWKIVWNLKMRTIWTGTVNYATEQKKKHRQRRFHMSGNHSNCARTVIMWIFNYSIEKWLVTPSAYGQANHYNIPFLDDWKCHSKFICFIILGHWISLRFAFNDLMRIASL